MERSELNAIESKFNEMYKLTQADTGEYYHVTLNRKDGGALSRENDDETSWHPEIIMQAIRDALKLGDNSYKRISGYSDYFACHIIGFDLMNSRNELIWAIEQLLVEHRIYQVSYTIHSAPITGVKADKMTIIIQRHQILSPRF